MIETVQLLARARREAIASKDTDEELAERLLSGQEGAIIQELAVMYLVSVVNSTRRAEARREEEKSDRENKRQQARHRREMRKLLDQADKRRDEEEVEKYGHILSWGERLSNAFDDFKAAVKLELTKELLQTSFALGDGSETTWGEASVDQHTKRREMLTNCGLSTLETAARHNAAIEMLEQSGKTCLNEL